MERVNSQIISQDVSDETVVKQKIRALFNKNNCKDIFKNSKINGEHIYEPMSSVKRIN